MAARVRPVLLHTTAIRGSKWELVVPRPFLKAGAFHLRQVQTISGARLLRRLGTLSTVEMGVIEHALTDRFGL